MYTKRYHSIMARMSIDDHALLLKRFRTVTIGALFVFVSVWWVSPTPVASAASAVQTDLTCNTPLPTIEWLGEGAGTYLLDDNFDTFIVKRLQPFRFVMEAGTANTAGKSIYQAGAGERVWRCAGH